METIANKNITSIDSSGEEPILPGAKLPPLPLPPSEPNQDGSQELRKAWVDYMVHGFKNNEETIQTDLKAADDDYRTSVERLITKHAELRGKRPGGDLGVNTKSGAG